MTTTPTDPPAAPRTVPGIAVEVALEAITGMAVGLQTLKQEVTIWGRPGRKGQAEIDESFRRLALLLEAVTTAFPLVLSAPRALLGQVADDLLAEHPDAPDLAEFVRSYLDGPPTGPDAAPADGGAGQ